MYGTIFRMKPKRGQEQALVALMDQWNRDRKPKIKGFVGAYILRPDKAKGEVIGVAIFSDHDAYMANANDPAQDQWYRQMREHLQADPKWEDGEVIAAS